VSIESRVSRVNRVSRVSVKSGQRDLFAAFGDGGHTFLFLLSVFYLRKTRGTKGAGAIWINDSNDHHHNHRN
jgi:hypothetical protein